MATALPDRLRTCGTLDAFYDARQSLHLHTEGRRFLHVELDITNRCNIRCIMCYHSFASTRQTRTAHLHPRDFETNIGSVLRHAYHVSLSLGNEPLMSPHFSDILRSLAPHRVPNVNFFTNGLLLTPSVIDAIVASGVTQVCVSIDGATAGTYNAIRRDGDFDQLVSNVKQLIARRNAAGSGTPHVRFDVTMMQRNVHELVAIVELAARLGVRQVAFRHLVRWEGLGMEHESLSDIKAFSNYCLDAAIRRAHELALEVQTHPEPFALGDRDRTLANVIDPTTNRAPYCPFPFFHVSMDAGGHVYPCPHAHGEPPYGRVSAETTLEAVWLGPRFGELRQRILSFDPPAMCRRCPFLADKYPNVSRLFTSRSQQ